MNDTPELAVGADAFTDRGAGLEVAIIGAGAVGVTAAYDLANEGTDVTIYDRGTVASGASGYAAGICYDAFADGLDAEIGSDAIERFRGLSGDDTFPFVECPYVWLAREDDDQRTTAISEQVAQMQRNGIIAVEMDGDDLGERFPALNTDDVATAGVAGGAGYTDPNAYTACLASAATGAGATLETDTPVSIRPEAPQIVLDESGERRTVDAVLVTAGAHTKPLLADAGLPIAMKPYRAQALTATGSFDGPMCYDASGDFYVRPHETGLLAGDGTGHQEIDPDDWDGAVTDGFETDLREQITHRYPGQASDIDRSWAGLCTATPDRDPLVGELTDGIYVATGFHGEGFMRAPAIGERIANELLGDDGIERFDPTRFTGSESFEIKTGLLSD